jgi:hypothetical protein
MKTPAMAMVLAFLAACTAGDPSRSSVVTRDSAGIEIIESLAPEWTDASAWRIAADPSVEIGLVEGKPEYLFSNIEGAAFLADGRIAVADRGSSQLRFFTESGTFERFVGGPGDGPGELGYIRGLGRCGADSLYVFEIDYQNVVFGPAGEYVREARPYGQSTLDRRPYALRCARNGYYAAVGWEDLTGPPRIGLYRADAKAWILAPAHSAPTEIIGGIPESGLVLVAELGTVLSSERLGTERGSRPHPFGRATRIAMTPTAIYMGSGEASEIRRFSLGGLLDRIVRWSGPDLSIRDADIEAYRAAQLANVSAADRPALERSLRELPMPPALPAFERIETDAEGNLWVQQFQRPGQAEHEWTVFDPRGVWLGSIELPARLEVTDISGDAILGIARDDLGVERIHAYALLKPRQS